MIGRIGLTNNLAVNSFQNSFKAKLRAKDITVPLEEMMRSKNTEAELKEIEEISKKPLQGCPFINDTPGDSPETRYSNTDWEHLYRELDQIGRG